MEYMGTATCDLSVVRYGTGEVVRLVVNRPKPVIEGYAILDYDKAPMLILDGVTTRVVEKESPDSSEPTLLYPREPFDSERAYYWGYNAFTDDILATVQYGDAMQFDLTARVSFAFIRRQDVSTGTIDEVNDIVLPIDDVCIYRQAADTESWGSEEHMELFIPWQDTR